MIPIPVLVSIINLALALQFSFVPSYNFMVWQRGSLGRNYPLPNLKLQHPRALRLSPSLPAPYERGGMPSLALPPSHAHMASLAPQAPFLMGHPCPLHYPGPVDPWPTLADWSGARGALSTNTHLSQPRS